MVLQDRNDVLTILHEPSSGEIKRALIAGVSGIANPRAQECLVEPYRVTERGSTLHIELEPSFGAARCEVCAPKDIASVASVVTGVEDNGCAGLSGVDSGSVVGRRPERVGVT